MLIGSKTCTFNRNIMLMLDMRDDNQRHPMRKINAVGPWFPMRVLLRNDVTCGERMGVSRLVGPVCHTQPSANA